MSLPDPSRPAAVVLRIGDPFAKVLPPGGGACVDPDARPPDGAACAPLRWRSGVLDLVLSAALLWRVNVSGGLVDWIVREMTLPSGAANRIRVVLDEALANALIHGALGIPGLSAFDGDSEAQRSSIEAKLGTAAYAAAPILVRLKCRGGRLFIHVDDWGQGYDPAALPPPDPLSVSGRGLQVILAFAGRRRVGRGGRRMSVAVSTGA